MTHWMENKSKYEENESENEHVESSDDENDFDQEVKRLRRR